jgi:4-amino-4-deoxy-L-arabinose transferase-like glycosyltransferase
LAVAAAFLGGVVIVLEGAFRAARLHGLFAWDAGAFWVPKAEAIFVSGGLDATHIATLPNPSYPPLLPVLHATAFTFMGEPNVVALHLVVWSLLVGFALGAGVLLSRFSHPALAWSAVLLVIAAPEVVDASRVPQADLLLDVFLAFALVLLLVWTREPRWNILGLALVFVAGAAVTKREGLLVVACIAAAVFLANRRRFRQASLGVLLVGATALLVSLPWRVWFTRRALPSDAPEAGRLGLFDHVDRLWPSTSLVLRTLGDPEHWSVLLVFAILALLASWRTGHPEETALLGCFLALSVVAFIWVEWAFPSLPLTQVAALNPIVRLCGAALLPAALCAPLLLQRALDETKAAVSQPVAAGARALAVGAVLALAAAYPLAVLAANGLPRFPDRDECVDVLAVPSEPFELVYDRRDSLLAARSVHERLVGAGFVDAEIRGDGCGRWKVVNDGVETLEQAEGHVADARRVGFSPRLEAP